MTPPTGTQHTEALGYTVAEYSDLERLEAEVLEPEPAPTVTVAPAKLPPPPSGQWEPPDQLPAPVTWVRRNADRRVDWAALFNNPPDGDDWLVEPFIARGRAHALVASAKTGKSLLTLWLAMHAATGKAPNGDPIEPVRVLYLDYEMTAEDVYERATDMGFTADDPRVDLLAQNFAYYLQPTLPPLNTDDGGLAVRALLDACTPDLVVFDTYSRVVTGKENDSETTQAFASFVGLELKRRGIAYLRLDHMGRDPLKGARGTSAKTEDVDVVWTLDRSADGLKLTRTHSRVKWIQEQVHLAELAEPLRWKPVDYGWHKDTKRVAALLDAIDVPLDWGRPKATKALREHDPAGKAPQAKAIADALKYRNRPEYDR